MTVAGAGAELWPKVEPEPKINDFFSATRPRSLTNQCKVAYISVLFVRQKKHAGFTIILWVSYNWNWLSSRICRRMSPKYMLNSGQVKENRSFFNLENRIFKKTFCFCPESSVPSLYPEIFYIITQWSSSASGSLWEMPDSNPGPQKSGALPMSHHISLLLEFTSFLSTAKRNKWRLASWPIYNPLNRLIQYCRKLIFLNLSDHL